MSRGNNFFRSNCGVVYAGIGGYIGSPFEPFEEFSLESHYCIDCACVVGRYCRSNVLDCMDQLFLSVYINQLSLFIILSLITRGLGSQNAVDVMIALCTSQTLYRLDS